MTASVATAAHPWLVADVGGTNARFGLVRRAGAGVDEVQVLPCAGHSGLGAAATAYLAGRAAAGAPAQPGRASFALAAAIEGDAAVLTNSGWTVSGAGLRRELGLQEVVLLNDFEALALSLPQLRADEIEPIANPPGARSEPGRAMAVVGPGTGLGVALCVPTRHHQWIAVAGEGGHASLAPADDFESALLAVVRREFPHVSAERMLSGIGLPTLHRAVVVVRGSGPAEPLSTEEIGQRALSGSDPDCVATIDTFFAMLGGFAGSVALTAGARGGFYIAGGIAQKLRTLMLRSRFRERFEAKGRFASYLAGIPTALIVAPYCAMSGAAQALVQKDY